jgi:hypothetical protein
MSEQSNALEQASSAAALAAGADSGQAGTEAPLQAHSQVTNRPGINPGEMERILINSGKLSAGSRSNLVGSETEPPSPCKFGYTLDELEQQVLKNPVHYVVDGLLPADDVHVAVGDSGLGKTPLAYQLGLCVAVHELCAGLAQPDAVRW